MATSASAFRNVPPLKTQRNPVSSAQVESVLSRSVAIFGALFGLQTVPALIDQLDEAHWLWNAAIITIIYGTLAFGLNHPRRGDHRHRHDAAPCGLGCRLRPGDSP
jgi:hypothetical protein